MADNLKITPVIMSGGAGTRMWPLSRKARPKQFHALLTDRSLFQETLARVSPDNGPFAPPVILASSRHQTLIEEDLRTMDVVAEQLILEPTARNTAPAIAALAVVAEAQASDRLLAVLPADHLIADAKAFGAALAGGRTAAAAGHIVTFGVSPSRPETGYGYIQAGAALDDASRVVAAFKEKPDRTTAENYVASGDYFWNAGVFMFRPDVMIEELARYAPAVLEAARAAAARGKTAGAALTLEGEAFQKAPDISIDYAVMERTQRAAIASLDVQWSDVGFWEAVWDIAQKDGDGNATLRGEAILVDTQNTLAVSDGQTITAIGVKDLVIVSTTDGVLVAPRERSQEVKAIVEQLKNGKAGDLL